ncbi:hypothetical protein F2P81_002446 [Scophthalmus maximus]|uniref:Splicing factor U2AF 35 kDa subunit n=1 Tax=Scophthalmus maximus TaxID=52904 RepID=A0A6A4TGT9_SCOMX|nr:hypothetical protein F2P81_002446 [Scophthalmus maximus]
MCSVQGQCNSEGGDVCAVSARLRNEDVMTFPTSRKWRSTWRPFSAQRKTKSFISQNVRCAFDTRVNIKRAPRLVIEQRREHVARVNCSFYFKIGACRHGDRCSRLHNKPTFSQTILIQNIYRNPQNSAQTADASRCAVSDVEMQEHYDEFFEEVFTEMEEKYGEVEEMNVCDNLGDHLVGNVYVKFRREEDAEKAVMDLNNRWFNAQPIHAELSPVTDFREACCRQYEMGECTRGGFCNFMHLKPISRELRRELYGRRRKRHRSGSRSRERRSRSRDRRRDRERPRRSRDRVEAVEGVRSNFEKTCKAVFCKNKQTTVLQKLVKLELLGSPAGHQLLM